ncbi:MAG: 16S rRNA (cytosine(1402)-N(4))-methyltransferase [Deltaproteobacteria bacterium RIFOXYA12_FULL_61_11]|nr:MAG: 16S rRNA (cytosine(1402)-N(4))-methyltransferase [Deltaproteobacteria bacterium RIFOXYA12_FULL_61_11]
MPEHNDNAAPRKARRVRYRGTHPRKFEEKYKEFDPERYGEELEKVLGRGQTPASTHRAICVQEVLGVLEPRPGQTGLDATLGYGGHARELLGRIVPGGCLWGLDVDPVELPKTVERLEKLGYAEPLFMAKHLNFAGIPKLLPQVEGGFDFILADLGVSSMQLDNPARGFTYKRKGPLDLRLNPTRGQPASVLLRTVSQNSLAALLSEYSDEPYAKEIASVLAAKRKELLTTTALAEAVREAVPRACSEAAENEVTTSIRRTFQSLRILVNDEFSALEQFLRNLPLCLAARGRVAVLTFHSGEARRVAAAFEAGLANGTFSDISREPLRPSPHECYANPRAKAAQLFWAVRS